MTRVTREYIKSLPKAELHLHLEGSLEPELMFKLAKRNNIRLNYSSVEEIKKAYKFKDLQSFLDIYYQGAEVLVTAEDFYDLTTAYLQRCMNDGIDHVEPFFDPQTHLERGVPLEVQLEGIGNALRDAGSRWGITSGLILSILRHLPAEDGMRVYEMARPMIGEFIGIGLDSSELNHPPRHFAPIFEAARADGLRVVAHAGEEGPPSYVWEALQTLRVQRIDHGVRALEDATLVSQLIDQQTPLTVCPNSNIRLKVYQHMAEHPILHMLDQGMNVSINSDDPAYFGGYLVDNFMAVNQALGMSRKDAALLARNSISASFVDPQRKAQLLARLPIEDIRS